MEDSISGALFRGSDREGGLLALAREAFGVFLLALLLSSTVEATARVRFRIGPERSVESIPNPILRGMARSERDRALQARDEGWGYPLYRAATVALPLLFLVRYLLLAARFIFASWEEVSIGIVRMRMAGAVGAACLGGLFLSFPPSLAGALLDALGWPP